MGDFEAETRLTDNGGGTFSRAVSREFEIWGPNGGYMAALALRAAAQCCGRARPANASVHFLGVASFDEPVTITPTTLRSTRHATSVQVAIEQAGKPILQALIWAIDDGLPGVEHADIAAPDLPLPAELPTIQERLLAQGVEPKVHYPFWNNFDVKPTDWIVDWEARMLGPAIFQEWLRFLPRCDSTDRWLHAARLLLLVDLGAYPALGRRHNEPTMIAPSLDVSCEFHLLDPADDWLLLCGTAPHGGEGLVGSASQVFNERGQMVAHGISHLMCKYAR